MELTTLIKGTEVCSMEALKMIIEETLEDHQLWHADRKIAPMQVQHTAKNITQANRVVYHKYEWLYKTVMVELLYIDSDSNVPFYNAHGGLSLCMLTEYSPEKIRENLKYCLEKQFRFDDFENIKIPFHFRIPRYPNCRIHLLIEVRNPNILSGT